MPTKKDKRIHFNFVVQTVADSTVVYGEVEKVFSGKDATQQAGEFIKARIDEKLAPLQAEES